jgi:hypothetical protein
MCDRRQGAAHPAALRAGSARCRERAYAILDRSVRGASGQNARLAVRMANALAGSR